VGFAHESSSLSPGTSPDQGCFFMAIRVDW